MIILSSIDGLNGLRLAAGTGNRSISPIWQGERALPFGFDALRVDPDLNYALLWNTKALERYSIFLGLFIVNEFLLHPRTAPPWG
jgi:hypothetical protein